MSESLFRSDPEGFRVALLCVTLLGVLLAWCIVIHLGCDHLRKPADTRGGFWADDTNHLLVCIVVSITAFFVDFILTQELPSDMGTPILKYPSLCRFEGFWASFSINIAALWCTCASHHFLRRIKGQPSLSFKAYHLVAWGTACGLGVTSAIWAQAVDSGFEEYKMCLYYGEHNQRMVVLNVVPMLLMWLFMASCLWQSASFLDRFSTGTVKLWIAGAKTVQQYFLAVLILTWAPFMLWQCWLAQSPPPHWLSKLARINLGFGGGYTSIMYLGVIKLRRNNLGGAPRPLDASCIHFDASYQDGSSDVWRHNQELLIEHSHREACDRLFPAVRHIMQQLAPEAPDSHTVKATTSIVYQSEYGAEELVRTESLLREEVSDWIERTHRIAQRRLTGLPERGLQSPGSLSGSPVEEGSRPVSTQPPMMPVEFQEAGSSL